MKRPATAIAFLLLVLAAVPASAREWWTSADGDSAVEGWGYVKDSLMAAHFRDVYLYPAEGGGLNSFRARIGVDAYKGHFKFSTELELSLNVAFQGMTDGVRASFASTAARPRLWDPETWERKGATLGANIDRLYFRYAAGPVDITVGRQAISWGTAWFWKPTDRFAPFSPSDIDPDVKRGVDAVRLEAYINDTTSLDIIATFERHEEDDLPVWTNAGVRARTTVGRYDLAFSIARFQATSEGNWMVGAEFTGELPRKVGFRGEAAFNIMENSHNWDIDAVLGVDYRFATRTTLAAEVMYNGYGAADPEDYWLYLLSTGRGERLARGEAFNIGRYYLGAMVSQEVTPLLTMSFSAIANLRDPSALFMAVLAWSAAENVKVTAGILVPAGARPEPPDFAAGRLTPDMGSEYGMAPVVGYTVLKFSY